MYLTKHTLGRCYVVGAGVLLSIGLLAHASTALEQGWLVTTFAVVGLVPSLALAGAHYWLPASGLEGEQVWTVAKWIGLGIGLVTLGNVVVLGLGLSFTAETPVLLATSIAIASASGFLVGTVLELRHTNQRLQRSNEVLDRVLRHNLRNDLTVVNGHLDELKRSVTGPQERRVQQLEAKVGEIVATTEKARQIDVALAAEHRSQEPIEIVANLESRIAAVGKANPDATVETDLPDETWVYGDWLVGTVLDNVVENVVVHAETAPHLAVSVEQDRETVTVMIADDCPQIPEHERSVFERATEHPLDHSTGVGLWLVQLIMESYDGSVRLETSDAGGNRVDLVFRAASGEGADPLGTHLRRLLDR